MEVSFLGAWKQSANIQCVQCGIVVYQPPSPLVTRLVPTGQTNGSLLACRDDLKKNNQKNQRICPLSNQHNRILLVQLTVAAHFCHEECDTVR